jgi:hypothetical protein
VAYNAWRHHTNHNRAKALTRASGLGTLSSCGGSTSAQPVPMTLPPVEEMCMTKAELVDQVAATVQLSKV